MINLMTSKDMILTFVLLFVVSLGHASGSCLKPNRSWLSVDILETVQAVPDPYQCQAICVDTEGCAAFTWTTADNQKLELHCFLFGSIANQTSFDECVSGPPSCTCSTEVACHGDAGNIVDEVAAVETEAECQMSCQENMACMFYTWSNGATFPPYYCVLLSSCQDTTPCQGCYSGPQECSQQISTTTSTSTPTMEGKDIYPSVYICQSFKRVVWVVVVQSYFCVNSTTNVLKQS